MKTTELKQQIELLIEKINNTKNETRNNFVNGLTTEIDINYYLDDATTFDELMDAIENNNGFDIEIIYYSNAIKYLMENDNSLRDSLEIASEYGYEVDKLNSEILASLLASRIERDNFHNLQREFEAYFENLAEYNEDLERLTDLIDEIDKDEATEEQQEEVNEIENKY